MAGRLRQDGPIWYVVAWVEAGYDEDFVYTQEHLDSYPKNLEFYEWATGLDTESLAYDRMLEIRDMAPALG